LSRLLPISRRELIKRLKKLGFEGPISGGKHQYMTKGAKVIRIPNPHKDLISVDLLLRILKQADIFKEEWINLK
jgi:predicted RNA binding protein YcfA (HicA-like mRNA interferase family)